VRITAVPQLPSDDDGWVEVDRVDHYDRGRFLIQTELRTIYWLVIDEAGRDIVRIPPVETIWFDDRLGKVVEINSRPLPVAVVLHVRTGRRGLIALDLGDLTTPLHTAPIVRILKEVD
jgi:hypothetical protein